MVAAALLAGFGSDGRRSHAPRVNRLQRARLQRAAFLADAPSAQLAPGLHEGRAVAEAGGRQAGVVLRQVLRLRPRQLVVQEELLLHAGAVRRPPLLVGRDLLAAELLEGPLPATQRCAPRLGHGLALLRSGSCPRPSSRRPLGLEGLFVEPVAQLFGHFQDGRVVDVGVLGVVGPEALQRLCHAGPAVCSAAGVRQSRLAWQPLSAIAGCPARFSE